MDVDNENLEKGQSSYGGVIAFLVIFAVVAVIVTVIYASKYNESNVDMWISSGDDLIESGETILDDTKYASQYDEMCYTNAIKTSFETYVSGEKFESIWGEEFYEEEVKYIQIDGLKNEAVEEKINNKIKNAAFDVLERARGYKIKETSASVNGNFSNILSIGIFYNGHNGESYAEGTYHENRYLNIDLSTGNDIEFEDLFLSDASIKNILTKGIYEDLQKDSAGSSFYFDYIYGCIGDRYYEIPYEKRDEEIKKLGLMTYDEWMDYYVRGSMEEELIKILQKIDKGDFEYFISENMLIINVENKSVCYIYLRENLDSLALYKRFLTEESIFDGQYTDVKVGLCGFYMGDENRKVEKISDNLFLCSTIYYSEEYKNYLDMVNEKIEAEIKYANSNPNKVYILGVTEEYNYAATTKIEINKDDFERNKNEILKTLNDTWGFEYNEGGSDEMISKDVLEKLDIDYIYSGGYKYNTKYETNEKIGLYLIDDSDVNVVTQKQLDNLTLEDLEIAYNEIFARHGHDFKDKNLREYFIGHIWYKPLYGKTVALEELNEVEKQNINIIKNEISARKAE